MLIPATARRAARQRGTSMIEVLVSIVIVVLGLLGLAGLQTHASLAEAESFQRAQAILLLQDMVDRINANRLNAASYVTAVPLGTGDTPTGCGAMTGAARDKCEWSSSLLGSSESVGASKVGAMIDARGCVQNIDPNMPRKYLVSVVWQGVTATKAPGTLCGSGLYGDDKTRRALTAVVTVGCLQNDPASGTCVYPP